MVSRGMTLTVAARARGPIIGLRYGLPLYFARSRDGFEPDPTTVIKPGPRKSIPASLCHTSSDLIFSLLAFVFGLFNDALKFGPTRWLETDVFIEIPLGLGILV